LRCAASIPNDLAAGGEGVGYEGNTVSADKETISELVLKAKKTLVDSGGAYQRVLYG